MAAQPQNEVTPAQAGLFFNLGQQEGVLMGGAGAAPGNGGERNYGAAERRFFPYQHCPGPRLQERWH